MGQVDAYKIGLSRAGGALAYTTSCAANVVVNGGFETGDFTGWAGGLPDSFVASGNTFFVHSGTYGVAFGSTSLSYLSQTLSTTIGTVYDVSFWLDSNGPDNQVKLSWGGQSIFNEKNIAADGWTEYSFTETATLTSTLLWFGLKQVTGYSGLDDVSVTPTSAVPEPSTWTMMLLGFAWNLLHRKPPHTAGPGSTPRGLSSDRRNPSSPFDGYLSVPRDFKSSATRSAKVPREYVQRLLRPSSLTLNVTRQHPEDYAPILTSSWRLRDKIATCNREA